MNVRIEKSPSGDMPRVITEDAPLSYSLFHAVVTAAVGALAAYAAGKILDASPLSPEVVTFDYNDRLNDESSDD